MPLRRPANAKLNGIQYTPPELARFLAEALRSAIGPGSEPLSILDPACGNGELLLAYAQATPEKTRESLILSGFETDSNALAEAKSRLDSLVAKRVALHERDFLQQGKFCLRSDGDRDFGPRQPEQFDTIIANPPYVRTQTLGAKRSQQLAAQFGLQGRVDLSYAFAAAMAAYLKPGGVLGLLTSNRFLNVKSGACLRKLLLEEFEIECIFDLGDTRLFAAAVLPAIVIARKVRTPWHSVASYDRVYECRTANASTDRIQVSSSLLDAVRDRDVQGSVRANGVLYKIERGQLHVDPATGWSLSTPDTDAWLLKVRSRQACTFGDVAKVRVGIKTTADDVFIRSDWESLPESMQPEAEWLRPLLAHPQAGRWSSANSAIGKSVLYPHEVRNGKRCAIDLARYPRTAAYLECHRTRLEARQYVIDSGRKWYEIWVPHRPTDWLKPKIVWPDIAEEPRFFLDSTGSIANGDCYWLALEESQNPDWLLLMMAIANSSFATRFYDTVFHNKLYAGRRRFMTQYVSKLPLPDLYSAHAQQLISLASRLVKGEGDLAGSEAEIDRLVAEALG